MVAIGGCKTWYLDRFVEMDGPYGARRLQEHLSPAWKTAGGLSGASMMCDAGREDAARLIVIDMTT
jgi:hypothetical protein